MTVTGGIAPIVIQGQAGFPWYRITKLIADSCWWDHLLRRCEIAGIFGRICSKNRTGVLSTALQTVINDQPRLDGTHHGNQLLGFPFVALHISVGEVEPHQIQLTIIGKKLFNLTKHKFQITVEIAVFIGAFRMVAHWMVHISIVREIRMAPVYDGKIQTDFDSFRAERLQKLFYQVFVAGCIHGIVVSKFGVKKAKAVMVFGCEHSIFHARLFRKTRPLSWVVILSCELFCEMAVVLMWNLLHAAHPFSSGRDCIKSPVNKHAETGVTVPFGTFCSFFDYFVHFIMSFPVTLGKILFQFSLHILWNFPFKGKFWLVCHPCSCCAESFRPFFQCARRYIFYCIVSCMHAKAVTV